MKRQLILSGAILLGALSLSQINQCKAGYYIEQIHKMVSWGAAYDSNLLKSIEPLHQSVIEFEKNEKDFLANSQKVDNMSSCLNEITSPIERFQIKTVGFYYPLTNRTYFYKKRFFNGYHKEFATPPIDMATTFAWQIGLKSAKPSRTFNFEQQYNEAFAPLIETEQYNRKNINGLLTYITTEYLNDVQKRKFPKEIKKVLGQMLKELDSNADDFLSGLENIHTMEYFLYKIIESIDIGDKPGDFSNVEFPQDFMPETIFYPNYRLVEKLLHLADQINILIKTRMPGITVYYTYGHFQKSSDLPSDKSGLFLYQ
jgi:hypothetical protein